MALQTYIAVGFTDDCKELIETLTKRFQKVDWHNFCYYWKEMQFDILFYGRQSGPEIVEFTEELLQTARLYIVTETDNFEDQVVGLFIAYAITIIQPYKNLCALRLVPKDVAAFMKIEAVARRDGRSDILMVLGKMHIYGKIQYHVSLRERAMDISIRKYFDGSTNVPQCIARHWHGRLNQYRVNALENIAHAESTYTDIKKKAKLAAESVFPGTNVKMDMFKPGAKQMADSLRKLILGGKEGTKQKDDESDATSIKQKAMKITVDPMKHLHGLADRQKDKEPKVVTSKHVNAKKTRHKCSKQTLKPKIQETDSVEPFLSYSLPSLDEPQTAPNIKDKHEGSPEPPFRGFTAEEIQLTDYMETMKSQNDGKGNSAVPLLAVKKKSAELTKKSLKSRSPGYNGSKRKNSHSDAETTKKKRKLKNKLNKKLKLANDFNSGDSDTTSSDDDPIIEKPLKPNTECKGKELTIQSKGVLKHFVEFELNDLVIRTEKDAPPENDIEIEYIDNYRGTNALYEEVCEVSDDDEVKKDSEIINGICTSLNNNSTARDDTTERDEFGGTQDDMEVFQIVTEDTKSKHKKARKKHKDKLVDIDFSSIDDGEVDETIMKVLSKNYTQRKTERRRLKQPNLRSKLKKMGLLPVANFDDESN